MKNPSRRRVAIALLAVMLSAATHSANAAPVDFARAELASALRERGLPSRSIEVSIEPGGAHESWSLDPATSTPYFVVETGVQRDGQH
jgi:hypothetical protein